MSMARICLLLLVCSGCLASIGCSTLIPGLNLSEKDVPKGQYRIVPSDKAGTYEVAPGDGTPISVIDITPELIVTERQTDLLMAVNGLPVVTPASTVPEYLIGPGDVLQLVVWDHPELTNPSGFTSDPNASGRLVASDGTMFFPYVGTVKAAGKTVAMLRNELAASIVKFIANPQIDIRVLQFRSKRIQVSGEIKAPGLVTLDDTPKGVLEAIAERGGLTDTASRRRLYLVRNGQAYPVDLARLLSGHLAGGNPVLLAGDTIHIPDRSGDQVFVLGSVANQGPYAMQQETMTLTEALSQAKGLDGMGADDSGVLVFRRPMVDGQAPRIFKLDMSVPQGLILAGEFQLNPRDVVYVKRTRFSQYNLVLNQILPTISALFQLNSLGVPINSNTNNN